MEKHSRGETPGERSEPAKFHNAFQKIKIFSTVVGKMMLFSKKNFEYGKSGEESKNPIKSMSIGKRINAAEARKAARRA